MLVVNSSATSVNNVYLKVDVTARRASSSSIIIRRIFIIVVVNVVI